MNWWTNFVGTVQKDEQWVVAELQKGWMLLQTVGHTAEVDIEGVFTWIKNHQANLQSAMQTALGAVTIAGSLIPQIAPAVPIATAAMDAAEVAIDKLSQAVVAGATPLSTAVNAYHAVKDAVAAASPILKAGTAKPAA